MGSKRRTRPSTVRYSLLRTSTLSGKLVAGSGIAPLLGVTDRLRDGTTSSGLSGSPGSLFGADTIRPSIRETPPYQARTQKLAAGVSGASRNAGSLRS